MNSPYPIHWPSFFTATIQQWKPLLTECRFKDIIVESLQFLVKENRIVLNAFVIMNNHFHLIWQPLQPYTPTEIQSALLKFTSMRMKAVLEKEDPELLSAFKVNKVDRHYQFWKRESLGIELFTPAVFYQKLDYIHSNPLRAGLCTHVEEYYYSSAKFYQSGGRLDDFGMLSHYM